MDYFGNSNLRYLKTIKAIPKCISDNVDSKILDIGGYSVFEKMLVKEFGFNNIKTYSTKDLNNDKIEAVDNQFDLVILGEVIEHLYDPDNIIKECYRILKSKGALLITTPNLLSWYNRILLILGYYPLNLDISCEVRKTGERDILSKLPLRDINLNPLHDVHIKLHTFKTLEILLKTHNFSRIEKSSYFLEKSAHYNIGNILRFLNRMFSSLPNMSQGIIMIGWKP